MISLADEAEPFLSYRCQILPASLMNSVLVLHSKQAVRDGAATEGTPRKAKEGITKETPDKGHPQPADIANAIETRVSQTLF